jgi:signal transduction histidine kinase
MKSIRWKLILITFGLVFVPMYFLNQYTLKSFNKFTSKALEEEMISQALMLGEHYRATMLDERGVERDDRRLEFMQALWDYDSKLQSRFQILSAEGVVTFDSDADSLVESDFSERPEIANAIVGERYKAAWRLDRDLDRLFYFVPLPIKHEGKVIAISYVTHHTGQITKAILTMIHDQHASMIIALLFAALVSAIFSYTITYRLRVLTKSSMAYARGDKSLDIRIKGRDEVAELADAVEYMADEIEKRNEYNKEFLSTVMHELKTPVTAIRGAAEVLEEGGCEKPDIRAKFLSNIIYEANRLNRMVGELSEVTKMDVESLRGHKSKVNYAVYLNEALERLMPTFDQEHAEFSAVVADDIGETMIVPGRIEQVISNLLENAFRFTPPSGKVTLEACKDENGMLRTCVRDTGPGISDTARQKVFDRFYTTEPKDVPKDYGSGLGLAIAKSIVENHQGRIWVDDSDSGACLCFVLPSAEA